MKRIYLLVMMILLSGFAACATINKTMTGQNDMPGEEDRREIVKKFPDITDDQKAKFIAGDPWIGMSQAQLDAHFGGTPAKSQKKLTDKSTQVIHLYGERIGNWKTGIVTKFFRATMTEGKLSEIQELDNQVGSFDKL